MESFQESLFRGYQTKSGDMSDVSYHQESKSMQYIPREAVLTSTHIVYFEQK